MALRWQQQQWKKNVNIGNSETIKDCSLFIKNTGMEKARHSQKASINDTMSTPTNTCCRHSLPACLPTCYSRAAPTAWVSFSAIGHLNVSHQLFCDEVIGWSQNDQKINDNGNKMFVLNECKRCVLLCATYTWHSPCQVNSHHDSQSETNVDGQGLPKSPFTQHRLGHWTTSEELGHRKKHKGWRQRGLLFLIIPITPAINTSFFCPPTAWDCHRQFFQPKIMTPPPTPHPHAHT